MFEKFTEKAKRILFLARYEASHQGSKVIGTEHILLALLKEGEETTRELFTRANVSMDLLQAELERRSPAREKLSTSVEIPFSEETKKVLQFGEEEAERLMHPHIGTEDLLLGLLRLEDSVGAGWQTRGAGADHRGWSTMLDRYQDEGRQQGVGRQASTPGAQLWHRLERH